MKKVNLYFLVAIASMYMASMAIAETYPEGMVAYWKFDEGSGVTAGDAVSANDGVINGATWTAGMVGHAMSFDGINDYVLTSFNPHDAIGDGNSFTKTFWFNQGADAGKQDIFVAGPLSPRFYFVYEPQGHYGVGFGNNYYGFNFLGDPINTWIHVTIVFDSSSSELRVYQNGNSSPIYTVTYTGNGLLPSGGLQFSGRSSNTYYAFTGMLDEVAIYNRAITPEEILRNYENGLNGLGYGVPDLTCNGFEPPMAGGPVKVRKNRALPLKAEIFNADGFALNDTGITAPPVVQVWFDSSEGGDAVDVTDDVLSVGQGDEGNQFVFTEGERWQFNLSTKSYTSPGTYTVLMQSGDDSEYVFEPTCMAEFVIK